MCKENPAPVYYLDSIAHHGVRIAFYSCPGDGGPAAAPSGKSTGSAEHAAQKAEGAFNRVLAGTTGLPGTTATGREAGAKIAELEKMSRDNRIRERLAAIKATQAGSTE